MRNYIAVAVVAAALALGVSACITSKPATQDLTAEAASGDLTIVATLAVGEFDAKAAPLYNKLALQKHNAAVALQKGRITVDEAKAIRASANQLAAMLDDAQKTCRPDNQGRCTGNARQADDLVGRVAAALNVN